MPERLILSMISRDARHTITVSEPEEGGRRIVVNGPEVFPSGEFMLNIDAETARQVGGALDSAQGSGLREVEASRAALSLRHVEDCMCTRVPVLAGDDVKVIDSRCIAGYVVTDGG